MFNEKYDILSIRIVTFKALKFYRNLWVETTTDLKTIEYAQWNKSDRSLRENDVNFHFHSKHFPTTIPLS